ncbi:hypothetical protein RhoFasK5_03051|nr:hypothetical protein [Rhodococcus kroppenstedtii]
MRSMAKLGAAAAGSVGIVFALPSVASAADGSEVSFSYSAEGSTISNAITNTTDSTLRCSTSLEPAPDGVLPPLDTILGQDIFTGGDVPPGTTTQQLTDVPDGSWAVLVTCSNPGSESPATWLSDYPGVEDYLTRLQFPTPWFAVDQASTVLTVPAPASGDTGSPLDGLSDAFGS